LRYVRGYGFHQSPKKVCCKVSRWKNLWENCFSIQKKVFHRISIRLNYYY